MDSTGKNAVTASPMKDPNMSKSKIEEFSKLSENTNPNVTNSSPATKSAKTQKSASKNKPNPVVYSPRNKIRERKFVVAKKKNSKNLNVGGSKVECKCKAKTDGDIRKCLCVAYENLRASHEEFFKNRSSGNEDISESDKLKESNGAENELEEEIEKKLMIQDLLNDDGYEEKIEKGDFSAKNERDNHELGETKSPNQVGSTIKRRRERLLEEARNSVPESGKVMHLVKAFERLRTIPNSKDSDQKEEDNKKAMKWALPGLQLETPKVFAETTGSCSSFCPSELCLTVENLGLDRRTSVSASWDGNQGSTSSRTSNGGRRSRRNSTESYGTTVVGRKWKKKKQLKVTSQKPFMLRTEQRGKMKEEEFIKKIQEMMTEEEKQRIPIAQGLPWTTDEPEVIQHLKSLYFTGLHCLIKPPVKESTRPIDLLLHSDVRAVERAEFDHQVAEKMSLIELYKMERERQQELEEEEEIRRLRKELVPKAQPMPYFDRPFVPRRSIKQPTIPKEPRFHIPELKKIKCCTSWNEMSTCTFQS